MDIKKIAKKLVQLRGDTPLKVAADAIGITKRALLSYEYGERIPRDEVKIKIAQYYDLSVQDIFFDIE